MSPSQTTSSPSSTVNASSTPTPTNTSINAFATTKDGSLSIGAKAGIALAALIFTALVLLGILYVMKRKKQSRKASGSLGAGVGGAPLARDQSSDGSVGGEVELEKRTGYAVLGAGEGRRAV